MPSDGEVHWARGRTQDAGHLLALVVWLKSYQRLGYSRSWPRCRGLWQGMSAGY